MKASWRLHFSGVLEVLSGMKKPLIACILPPKSDEGTPRTKPLKQGGKYKGGRFGACWGDSRDGVILVSCLKKLTGGEPDRCEQGFIAAQDK